MKRKAYIYPLLVAFCGLLFSCEDDNKLPQKLTNQAPPALSAEDVSWRPISGGAVIKYRTPQIQNIRGIEAKYQLETGKEIVVRGSFLSDSIVVEGYSTETPKNIQLSVIDNSDNYSVPYVLEILPNKSPLSSVKETLKVSPDFGGMQISFKNVDRRPIATFISRVDGNDTLLIEQYYTDQANPLITIRGEKAEKSDYIFQFRDRWDNYTEKMSYSVTPLFEKKVEHFTYMPSEYFHNIPDYNFMYRWFDGETSAPGWGDIHWPTTNPVTPHWSAIRLTNPTALSRIVLWQFAWGATNYSHYYFGSNARKVELYGSTEANPKSGDPATSDSWEFIMLCEIKMPSGKWYNSDNNLSEEDFDVAKNRGHEFILPLKDPMPQYRALCFKVVEAFQGGGAGSEGGRLSEVQLFGDDRPESEKE
ncbi:MAG: DUF5126 domain-containing protein [Bacteroidales bacterium]